MHIVLGLSSLSTPQPYLGQLPSYFSQGRGEIRLVALVYIDPSIGELRPVVAPNYPQSV